MRPHLGLVALLAHLLPAVLLLVGSIVAWLQTFRALEYEPRAVQTAQQIASLVNLSRAALVYSDAITRVSLIKTLADQEGVRILPREPSDRYAALHQRRARHARDRRTGRRGWARARRSRASVNDEPGLWVGFTIESDTYWLLLDPTRFSQPRPPHLADLADHRRWRCRWPARR